MEILSIELVDSLLLMGTTMLVFGWIFIGHVYRSFPIPNKWYKENEIDTKQLIKQIYRLGFIPQIIWNALLRCLIRKEAPDKEDYFSPCS
ncbi:hypothetical protein LC040_14580 [Bacillus tianshenii]|nr:hypothetical protein LC040_14580 [Bacillus tianshenii]